MNPKAEGGAPQTRIWLSKVVQPIKHSFRIKLWASPALQRYPNKYTNAIEWNNSTKNNRLWESSLELGSTPTVIYIHKFNKIPQVHKPKPGEAL